VAPNGAQRRKADRPPERMRGKPSGADALRPAPEGANKRLAEPPTARMAMNRRAAPQGRPAARANARKAKQRGRAAPGA